MTFCNLPAVSGCRPILAFLLHRSKSGLYLRVRGLRMHGHFMLIAYTALRVAVRADKAPSWSIF